MCKYVEWYIWICVNMIIYVNMYLCIFVHMYTCICVYVYICTCIHVYVYICICVYMYFCMCVYITKGSSRGATLSFTLRSKGEGGQPRYLILQEIASHFSTPPPPHLPRTLRADSKHCNLQYFCSFSDQETTFCYMVKPP